MHPCSPLHPSSLPCPALLALPCLPGRLAMHARTHRCQTVHARLATGPAAPSWANLRVTFCCALCCSSLPLPSPSLASLPHPCSSGGATAAVPVPVPAGGLSMRYHSQIGGWTDNGPTGSACLLHERMSEGNERLLMLPLREKQKHSTDRPHTQYNTLTACRHP